MTGIVMSTGESKLDPHKVVRFFQACLNKAGNPIVFTDPGSLPAQRAHAKRLIAGCKCSWQEIRAIIRLYCADPWWVENQPSLAQVVKQLNRLQVARKQQVVDSCGYPTRWEDL